MGLLFWLACLAVLGGLFFWAAWGKVDEILEDEDDR